MRALLIAALVGCGPPLARPADMTVDTTWTTGVRVDAGAEVAAIEPLADAAPPPPDASPPPEYGLATSITSDYDKFDQSTAVVLRGMKISPRTGPATFFIGVFALKEVKGKKPANTDVHIMWVSMSETWLYLKCRSVDVLSDGKPVKIVDSKYDGKVLDDGSVTEQHIIAIDRASFARMARGTTIEARVCNDEFELSPAKVAQFREFIELLESK